MKTIIAVFLVCCLSNYINAQINEPGCSLLNIETTMDLSQKGGKYITSSGVLKVLVVFAKFKNDTSPHPYWPANSYPSEMSAFIDANDQTNSSHYLNLTNYFNQMSFGNIKVIGVAVGQQTPYEKSHYIHTGSVYPNRSEANEDILLAVDNQVNYNQFDNWTYNTNYVHRNVPDGIIDMVIVIWRDIVFCDPYGPGAWSGEASLGGGPEFWVENNQKKIRMDFGADPTYGPYGSGVTIQYWALRDDKRNFKVSVHEVAHWLIGGVHPFVYGDLRHSFWGMLTLADQGICANSYERERLAWINPTPIEGTILSAPMSDYITTPSSYKYHPNNGIVNEMYFFENHQKISLYDNGTTNSYDKGIFILHVQDGSYNGNIAKIRPSSGFWNWNSPYATNCWGNNLPAFQKSGVNRDGYGNRDRITSTNSITNFLYAYINDDNQVECNDWMHGYGFTNAFTPTYNDVFSPWSNPPAKTWTGLSTDFLMEVTNEFSGIVTARFAIQNAIGGKPSKPQNPQLSANPGNGLVRFSWEFHLAGESDVNLYEVSRKVTELGGVWQVIGTTTNDYFVDTEYLYAPGAGDFGLTYRVRAKDTQNNYSIYSDVVRTRAEALGKESYISAVVENYELSTNYPNPFNPSTVINYSVQEAGVVKIKVYDILGSEVAELVNEMKEAGYHSIEFNASNLPSGVYIYTLQVNEFSASQKMLLLK